MPPTVKKDIHLSCDYEYLRGVAGNLAKRYNWTNSDAKQDAIHEAALKCWTRRDKIVSADDPVAFAFRVVMRSLLDSNRKDFRVFENEIPMDDYAAKAAAASGVRGNHGRSFEALEDRLFKDKEQLLDGIAFQVALDQIIAGYPEAEQRAWQIVKAGMWVDTTSQDRWTKSRLVKRLKRDFAGINSL